MLDAKLVVVGGDAKAAEVKLKLPTIIGRGKEASLTVPHALVSRRHTEVFEKQGRLFVRDLGSLNGTFVNNTKIDSEVELEPNQLLTLGNITFRAVYEVAPSESIQETKSELTEDTVSFDEVKTEEIVKFASERSAAGQEKIDIVSGETVPVEIPSDQDKPKSVIDFNVDLDSAVPPEETPPVEEPSPVAEDAEVKEVEVEPAEVEASSILSEAEAAENGDTDKSLIDSNEFIFAEDEPDPAQKSVSVQALDELPDGPKQAVSFVGKVDFGDDEKASISKLEAVNIDLGDEKGEASVEEDSSLGSFLKKLPR